MRTATTTNRTRTGRARGLAGLVASSLLAALALVAVAPAGAAESQDGKLMLVLDSSGSMKERAGDGGTRIAAAKKALGSVIGELPDDQPVGLRVYGAKVFDRKDAGACTDTQRVVDLGTDNRDELRREVSKYRPYGETPIGNALKAAGDDLGSKGRRSIVLVSDGEATCAPDPCKVARQLSKRGIDLTIDVVGLDVSGRARAQLTCIADAGGGQYFDADDADDLTGALSTLAERAARPYEAVGRPISGGASQDDATAITSGDWRDTLTAPGTAEGERWYRFRRTIEQSSLHVSASFMNTGSKQDSLSISASVDGTDCGSRQVGTGGDYQPVLAAALTVPGPSGAEGCKTGDEVVVHVTRVEESGSDRDTSDRPLELRLVEEPPVTKADTEVPADVEQAEPSLEGATPAVGGQSFGTATTIEPGAVSGTLVPGETQVFAVEADWGQDVQASIRFDQLGSAARRALGSDSLIGASVWMYSQTRASVAGSTGSISAGGEATKVSTHSPTIAYANRTSPRTELSTSSLAGTYYVAVTARQQLKGGNDDVELPFTLAIDVQGEPQGAPDYVEKKTEAAREGRDDTEATDDGGTDLPVLPIALALGGVLLLAAAGGLVAVARARRRG